MAAQTEKLVFGMCMGAAAPGKSKSKYEFVRDPASAEWKELAAIPDWRRVLSSLYATRLRINGLEFGSAEHYLQYRKAAIADEKRAAAMFCLDPRAGVSAGTGVDAWKARKKIHLTPAQIAEWE